ncbi:MAG TPA: DJ-1/PfpI family protein [Saprospiraceae bacterium]|nr:DJ-1/PfpI family protein [Saprospiraceae bacterium]HMQ82952.1 DJ-1/PfpI family protein [Saprospiraceae bacterium]
MKSHLIFLISFFSIASLFFVHGQPIQRELQLNVALFVPNGAELLDFAGPGEVFSNADFNTYIIGFTDEPFTSQGFMKVVPNYTYQNCPKPDIIVIPGGGGSQFYRNPEVIEWVKKQCQEAMLLTVCTGAIVAARGGMLDGLKVTTHYSGYETLEQSCQNCEVLRDARFVDNDRIVTTAGISAGIDGALHLVSRIKGKKAAEKVAYYMMYDKWEPQAGLVNKESTFVQNYRSNGLDVAKKSVASGHYPYPGELSNLAWEHVAEKDFAKANAMMAYCLELYPFEYSMYEELSGIYQTQGKYVPIGEEALIDLALQGQVDEVIRLHKEVQATYPKWLLFRESAMNWAGYALMNRQEIEKAIQIFELNASVYPDSFNVYDSLGEAYQKAGFKDKAIANYKKSLELNPANENAKKFLEELGGNH